MIQNLFKIIVSVLALGLATVASAEVIYGPKSSHGMRPQFKSVKMRECSIIVTAPAYKYDPSVLPKDRLAVESRPEKQIEVELAFITNLTLVDRSSLKIMVGEDSITVPVDPKKVDTYRAIVDRCAKSGNRSSDKREYVIYGD